MKRNVILVVLMLMLCAFFCFGCGEVKPDPDPQPGSDPTPSVSVTKLEVTGAKTEFKWGEEFSADGIVVTATFSDGSVKQLTDADFKVSSSLFNSREVGTYNIQVTYGNFRTRYSVNVVPRSELKFLMIGNSYSDDAIEYVFQIASALGIKMTLGNLFIGDCTLEKHYNNLIGNSPSYEFRTCSEATGGTWENRPNTSSVDAIKSQEWDYISLQQNSTHSGHPETYFMIDQLIPEIRKYNTTAEFVWHMPWADAADSQYGPGVMKNHYNNDMMTMYNAYVAAVQKEILTRSAFVKVLSTGTAIQNARTSFIGPNNGPLNRDGHHLTYGLGRYIASLTVVATLTGADLTGLTWMPENVTEQQRTVAVESAMNAAKTPFAITQSAYPPAD